MSFNFSDTNKFRFFSKVATCRLKGDYGMTESISSKLVSVKSHLLRCNLTLSLTPVLPHL